MINTPSHGNSLAVQWLVSELSLARVQGSIRGQGTKIPQATQHGQEKTPKNKTNKKYTIP